MHFSILMTVQTPELEPNPIVDMFIEQRVEKLKSEHKESKRDIWLDMAIDHLNGMRTEFSRCIMAQVYDKMEPYSEQTENPKFLEFEDNTEELKEEYAGCTDCIKLPDGRILPADVWIFRNKFVIHEDGKVYQKNFGQLKQDKRSKRTKKMDVIRNYPYKKIYKTFDDFAKKCCGFTYNEHFGGYGYTFNPNAFYDWCVIGGRWPKVFLVKEDCPEYSIGDRSWNNEKLYEAPDGYRWVAAARKKDIQWQAMKDWKMECAKKDFHNYEQIYKTGIIPGDMHFCKICGNKLVDFRKVLYIEGETVESYLKRNHLYDTFKYPVNIHGFLDNEDYYDVDYVWKKSAARKRVNKQERINRIRWKRKIDNFIDSIPDDEVIVGVDCHV